MPLTVWLLLVAAASGVDTVDRIYPIPANGWSFVDLADLNVRQSAAVVNANFDVQHGPPVRMILMSREDLDRFKNGENHNEVGLTPLATQGRLQAHVNEPGEIVVVIENRSGIAQQSAVHLRISMSYVEAAPLSRQRQLTIIAIGFLVFFAIVTYSGRRLWRAVRR